MKRVVTGGDLSQRDMRPSDLLDRYLALAEADIQAFGMLETPGRERTCPACGGEGAIAFERMGFTYRSCNHCSSLFVSPLPDRAILRRYHHESRAEQFWRDSVLTTTANSRFRHALGPRLQWVAGTAMARLGGGLTVCDVGSLNPQAREILTSSPAFKRYVPVSLLDQTSTPASGSEEVDTVIAFETLERTHDLRWTLRQCCSLVRSGGLLFVSTLSASGFEVRLLGSRLRSLVPPIHLHLLSRLGWIAALEHAHFSLIEYSTPGGLDVQAVAEVCRRDPTLRLPMILDELVRHEDEEVTHAFQEVLQQAGLSSHVQFVAVARGTPSSKE